MAPQGEVKPAAFNVLKSDAVFAAKRLLGSLLVADIEGAPIRFKIVETEAYDQADAASHSYKGKTQRTEVMFGPVGRLYVYFTYGMHYCCNIVVGEEGYGAAVLIRAAEPLDPTPLLSIRRGDRTGYQLTNGPAKLCQALAITTKMNGHDLTYPPLQLKIMPTLHKTEVVSAPRVGIQRAKEKLWRFYIRDNPYVSVRS